MGRKQRGRYRKTRRTATKSTGKKPDNIVKKEKKLKEINILEGNEDLIKLEEMDGDTTIEVECGVNKADLYLSKLCQGSKGQCIYFQDSWLTPNEYQFISGRESAKDWKRSIKHDGKSLKMLYTKGVFKVHKASCGCNGGRTLTSCFRRTAENGSLSLNVSGKKTDDSEHEDDTLKNGTEEQTDAKSDSDSANDDGEQAANQKDENDNSDESSLSTDENCESSEANDADLAEENDSETEHESDTEDENDSIPSTEKICHSEDIVEDIPPEYHKHVDVSLENETEVKNTGCSDDKQNNTSATDVESSGISSSSGKQTDRLTVNEVQNIPAKSDEAIGFVGTDQSEASSECVQGQVTVSDSRDKATTITTDVRGINGTGEYQDDNMDIQDDQKVENSLNFGDAKNSSPECLSPIEDIGHPSILATNCHADVLGDKNGTPTDNELPTNTEVKPDVQPASDSSLQSIEKQCEEIILSVLDEVFQRTKKCVNDNEPPTLTPGGLLVQENNCYLKKAFKNSPSPARESKLSSIIDQLRSAREKEQTGTTCSTLGVVKKEGTETASTDTEAETKKNGQDDDLPAAVCIQQQLRTESQHTSDEVVPHATCVRDQETKLKKPVEQCALPHRQKVSPHDQSEKTTKLFDSRCKDSGRMSPVTGKTAEDIPDYKGPGSSLSYDDYMRALAGLKPQLPFPPVSVEQFALQKGKDIPVPGKKPESAQIPVHNHLKEKIPPPPPPPPPPAPAPAPAPAPVQKQEMVFSPAMYPHLLGAHLAFPWHTMPFLGLNPFMPLQHDFLNSLIKPQQTLKQSENDRKPEKTLKRPNRCNETALDLSNKKPKLDKTVSMKSANERLAYNKKTNVRSESNDILHSAKFRKHLHAEPVRDTSVKYSRSVSDSRAMDSVSSWINHSSVNKSRNCTCKHNSKNDMSNWDVDDVCQFVRNIPGCAQYVKKFRDHRVNGQCLPLLTTEQLTKCLKMTIGPALILTHSVAKKISETRKLMECEHCRPRDGLTVKTAI